MEHSAHILVHGDNTEVLPDVPQRFTAIYSDMVFEDTDLSWLIEAVHLLDKDGVIMVQTDHHTSARVDRLLSDMLIYVNDCVYKQEWGGVSQRYFPRKHDTIFIYARSPEYKFYPERVLVPKKTLSQGLNPSGRTEKIPCDVFDDLGNFSTTDSERIKDPLTGKCFQWQKPLKLMHRLLLPFTDEGDWILDTHMGTGTTGEWCVRNKRNFYGIEKNERIFNIAYERITHSVPNNFYRIPLPQEQS
jgi:site-specific DNA-methyltransferase (adenine-specific)